MPAARATRVWHYSTLSMLGSGGTHCVVSSD
jgi:hypothetical protein